MQEHFVSFLVTIAITWFTLHVVPGPAWGKYFHSMVYSLVYPKNQKSYSRSERCSTRGKHQPTCLRPNIRFATLITAVATMSNAKRLMVFNLSDTKVIVMCHPKVAKEILNSSQIKRSEEQRRMVVTQMVNAFTLNVGTVFEVRDLLKTASLCNMMGLVFGKEYI
ncbi:unnamed protein product [Brassica oleracea]